MILSFTISTTLTKLWYPKTFGIPEGTLKYFVLLSYLVQTLISEVGTKITPLLNYSVTGIQRFIWNYKANKWQNANEVGLLSEINQHRETTLQDLIHMWNLKMFIS